MSDTPFATPRDAALALLNSGARLSRKAGSFAGQLAVDPTPMTERQADWLRALLLQNGFAPLNGGDQ